MTPNADADQGTSPLIRLAENSPNISEKARATPAHLNSSPPHAIAVGPYQAGFPPRYAHFSTCSL